MDNFSRKKIIFVITKSVWGGAQRYVFDLATNLPQKDFESVVVAGGSGPLIEKLLNASIRVIPIQSLDRDISLLGDTIAFFKLIALFIHEKPDIIHLNSSKIGAVGALAAWLYNKLYALRSTPYAKIIFTAHGWAWDEPRPAWQKRLIAGSIKAAALLQDAIIILSHHDMATALSHSIPIQKLRAIPLGIPPAVHFLSPLDAQKMLSEKIGLTFHRPLFGTIAELTKNKGLPYLIQALIIVKQRVSRFTCIIIGRGEDENALRSMIEKNGLSHNVFLTGFVPDASAYLKAFDFFVLPSLKEGLPYVLLEALTAHVPIVASNVGGIPDLVGHEETGLLIPPRNSRALAEALLRIIQSPELRSRFAYAADKKIKAFPFEEMLNDTIALYLS